LKCSISENASITHANWQKNWWVSDPVQANVMGLRTTLMARVRLIVQTEGWKQAQQAEQLGLAQSWGNDLVC
jgi:predicted XRE-type DNA-binding protein